MTQPMQISDMLCFSLYSASHAMTHLYRPLLAPLGLTYPQYLVLVALWAEDGQNLRQLGATLELESNTLTPCSSGWRRRGSSPAPARARTSGWCWCR
ncbi:MarR family winged helix-turn-helix transcriptional regulator [Seohaeicola zhoushanensis]